MAQKIKFGYWGLRGLGQISRLLLAYTEADWQNVAYTEPNAWFATDKQTLGFDFPNLPYLIQGDFKLTQSSAIDRYIIEISNNKQLLGKNNQDAARVNQIVGVLLELRTNIGQLFFDKDWESKAKATWQKYQHKFQAIQKVAAGKDFILGELSYADFHIAEMTNYFEKLYPEQMKNYPSFNRIRENFNNLQKIKNYYALQTAIKAPFIPPNRAVIQL